MRTGSGATESWPKADWSTRIRAEPHAPLLIAALVSHGAGRALWAEPRPTPVVPRCPHRCSTRFRQRVPTRGNEFQVNPLLSSCGIGFSDCYRLNAPCR